LAAKDGLKRDQHQTIVPFACTKYDPYLQRSFDEQGSNIGDVELVMLSRLWLLFCSRVLRWAMVFEGEEEDDQLYVG